MPTRTAHTTWTGGLQDGTGTVTLVSSGLGSYEINFPKRAPTTPTARPALRSSSRRHMRAASPCSSRRCSARPAAASQSLDVTADVTLGPDPAGGFRISGIKLTVGGSAQGVSAEDFAKIAADAKASCPVSKALTGTTITLEVDAS